MDESQSIVNESESIPLETQSNSPSKERYPSCFHRVQSKTWSFWILSLSKNTYPLNNLSGANVFGWLMSKDTSTFNLDAFVLLL